MLPFPARDEADAALDHPLVKRVVEQLTQERTIALVEAKAALERANLSRQRQAIDPTPDQEGLWTVADNRKRKRGLYNLWRQSTLVGTFTDVIGKRFVSGEWSIVPRKTQDGKNRAGSPRDRLLLQDYFSHCNEEEDFKQILYKSVVDLVVFGETFVEPVYRAGIPYELYSCNTMALDTLGDGYGGVKTYTYGTIESGKRLKRIPPTALVRSWFPDLANTQKGFSLLEGMVNPLYSDNMMVKVQQKTFENMGSASETTYNLPAGSTREQAQALSVYLDELYSGVNNAGRERITFGGVAVQVSNRKGLDADFLQGRDCAKFEVLGRAHVPPAMVALIQSGSLNADTGASQERSFIQNVLNFYKSLLLEKLTYRIIMGGFGIGDWVLDVTFADFVGDPYAPQIVTVNEKREQEGKEPLDGWDVPIIALLNRAIQPEVAPGQEPPTPPAPPTPASVPVAGKEDQGNGTGTVAAAGKKETS